MSYGETLLTPPASEPITTAEAKAQIGLAHDADDTLIDSKIKQARQLFERVTNQQLISATWKLTLDAWPCDGIIRLPRAPVTEVQSVSYYDDGVLTEIDSDDYDVDTTSIVGRIEPVEDVWPIVDDEIGAIEVEYTAGYADADAVPEEIKGLLAQAAAYLYQQREMADIDWLEKLFMRHTTGTY